MSAEGRRLERQMSGMGCSEENSVGRKRAWERLEGSQRVQMGRSEGGQWMRVKRKWVLGLSGDREAPPVENGEVIFPGMLPPQVRSA